MDYLKLLNNSYATLCNRDDGRHPGSRLEYLGEEIFQFTTYQSDMTELFARKAIEVVDAITNRTTFDYIQDTENLKWYLLMCNIPFFADRIDWGTSIRGAWWDACVRYRSCGLYDGDTQLYQEMVFEDDEWKEFMRAVLAFAKEE